MHNLLRLTYYAIILTPVLAFGQCYDCLPLEASILTGGQPKDFGVSGYYAYIAEGDYGMEIYDISDPARPSLAAHYDTPGSAEGISVLYPDIYVADGDSGLTIFQGMEPQSLRLTGRFDTPGYAHDVMTSCGISYIADGDSGLQMVLVLDPYQPQYFGHYTFDGDIRVVDGNCGLISIIDKDYGLHILSHEELDSLYYRGGYGPFVSPMGIHVQNFRAFVADSLNGLSIIDIENLDNPVLLGQFQTPGNAVDLYNYEDRVYVACGYDGLQVVDISDPANPVPGPHIYTSDFASGVIVSNDFLYMVDNSQMYIFGLNEVSSGDENPVMPREFAISSAYPNPFNASISLEISQPQDAYLSVDIFDLLGRKVVNLHAGLMTAGKHRLEWNAVSQMSGAYLVTASSSTGRSTRKISLLK